MNYFAHAAPYLDRPYFLAGTAVPDWLTVVDRRLRLRAESIQEHRPSEGRAADVAAGIHQHLLDDSRFHLAEVFAATCAELTSTMRQALGSQTGLRSTFLSHLLIELLLDAALIADAPHTLTAYYQALEQVAPEEVEQAVNQILPRPAARLAEFIEMFRRERILCDYLDDARLILRINQILRRTRLGVLPHTFPRIIDAARRLVGERKSALLEPVYGAAAGRKFMAAKSLPLR